MVNIKCSKCSAKKYVLQFSHSKILFLFSDTLQVSRMDYQEVQHLLIEALKFRRKYMELSLQEFCKTTSKMIDKMLPPSSDFCVMGSDIRVTPGGDILPCKW